MSRYSYSQSVDSFSQFGSTNPTGPSEATLGFVAISLPLLVCCVAYTTRKYRALTLQRQVRRLERIWQIK